MCLRPQAPPRITCQWTVAPPLMLGLRLSEESGWVPASVLTRCTHPCSQCSLECRLGSAQHTLAGQHIPGAGSAKITCVSWLKQHPHPPATERNPRANSFRPGLKGSEQWSSLNLPSTVWAERTALCMGSSGRPRLYYLPSVSSCSGMRQQKQREQHSVNYAGDLSARSLSPWAEHPSQEQQDLRTEQPNPGPWAGRVLRPGLEPHDWRLTGGSRQTALLVLPLCYFLFYMQKNLQTEIPTCCCGHNNYNL